MDINVGHSLRFAQLQVLSRILAHISHDVQNHLAIIGESAGWIKDLLKLKSKQRFGRFFKRRQSQHFDIEPFLRSLSIIQKQIEEGSTLTMRFNSFVHRLEKTRAVFDGNKVLMEIQDILLRQAKDKSICLELKFTNEVSIIETDPSGFQLAVLDAVEHAMEGLKSEDCLALEAGVRGEKFQVCLTSPYHEKLRTLSPEELDVQDFYRDIVEDIGGQILRQSGDGRNFITLSFPLTTAET